VKLGGAAKKKSNKEVTVKLLRAPSARKGKEKKKKKKREKRTGVRIAGRSSWLKCRIRNKRERRYRFPSEESGGGKRDIYFHSILHLWTSEKRQRNLLSS